MTTEVTITGSGIPFLSPGRAGAGVLIRHRDTLVQVDAGPATLFRLTEAGVDLSRIVALFITHHHSDHLMGIPELVLTRWIRNGARPCPPLTIYCPDGPAVRYASSLFDNLETDIAARIDLAGFPDRPDPVVHPFNPTPTPLPTTGDLLLEPATVEHGDEAPTATPVTTVADLHPFDPAPTPTPAPMPVATIGEVLVESVLVEHGDVAPAVAYRFTTPDGVVVVSGDTRACEAVEHLATDADILVHEVLSSRRLLDLGLPQRRVDALARHHAEAPTVGALAARTGVAQLILTHLMPAPESPRDVAALTAAIQSGGYTGPVTVATDLHTTTI